MAETVEFTWDGEVLAGQGLFIDPNWPPRTSKNDREPLACGKDVR